MGPSWRIDPTTHRTIYRSSFVSVSDSPAEELEKLQQDYFEWRLRDHPELGTQYDINTHNDKLESYAMSIFQVRKVWAFLKKSINNKPLLF